MAKIKFIFNKKKDLQNIHSTANFKNKTFTCDLNPEILKIVKDKNYEDCENELEKYYEKVHNSKLIPKLIIAVNGAWSIIEDDFLKRLEIVMGQKIIFDEVTGYFTSVGRCPYNPDLENANFYFCGFNGIFGILKTTAHELMHIQFHNTYWDEIEKKIGKEKTWDLKEALTVLLNLEFKDLWFVKDKGYELHKELRHFIATEWKKEKDFRKLLNKAVDFLKD